MKKTAIAIAVLMAMTVTAQVKKRQAGMGRELQRQKA